MITTKYEEELSQRIAKVGDKFILRGDVYKTLDGGTCKVCTFAANGDCDMVPICCGSGETVHYIKLEENS